MYNFPFLRSQFGGDFADEISDMKGRLKLLQNIAVLIFAFNKYIDPFCSELLILKQLRNKFSSK